MSLINKICKVCKTQYHRCANCSDYYLVWKEWYCCKECAIADNFDFEEWELERNET